MKEIQVTMYEAENGTKFKTKELCLEYEEKQAEKRQLLEAIKKIKGICKRGECSHCPFYSERPGEGCIYSSDSDYPEDWDIF